MPTYSRSRISNDRLQYWADEEEEPGDTAPVQTMGFPGWLLAVAVVAIAVHALKHR